VRTFLTIFNEVLVDRREFLAATAVAAVSPLPHLNTLSQSAQRQYFELRRYHLLPGTKQRAFVDFIGSKEVSRTAEVSGYAGYEWRGTPDGFDTPGGAFRWGVGAGFPTRSPVRVYTELNGLIVSDDVASRTASLVRIQSSVERQRSNGASQRMQSTE